MSFESALSAVKSIIGKSVPTLISAHIAYNLARGAMGALGFTLSRSGSRHAAIHDPAKSADYIRTVFADYLAYGGLQEANLVGKTVLEVGTGDNFGVAILFLLHGAGRVVCYDRYYSRRDAAVQKAVYLKLRESLTDELQARFDALLTWRQDEPVIDAQRFSYVYGHGVEQAATRLFGEAFDLIVSRSVLEHVADVRRAFTAMDALLRPGGRMVHKIDLRDHGLFSAHARHPLTFLTIPETLYRAMVCFSGRPNRFMAPEYRCLMDSLHYAAKYFVTHIVDSGDLSPHPEWDGKNLPTYVVMPMAIGDIRTELVRRFRNYTDAELAITGIFMAAKKPPS